MVEQIRFPLILRKYIQTKNNEFEESKQRKDETFQMICASDFQGFLGTQGFCSQRVHIVNCELSSQFWFNLNCIRAQNKLIAHWNMPNLRLLFMSHSFHSISRPLFNHPIKETIIILFCIWLNILNNWHASDHDKATNCMFSFLEYLWSWLAHDAKNISSQKSPAFIFHIMIGNNEAAFKILILDDRLRVGLGIHLRDIFTARGRKKVKA